MRWPSGASLQVYNEITSLASQNMPRKVISAFRGLLENIKLVKTHHSISKNHQKAPSTSQLNCVSEQATAHSTHFTQLTNTLQTGNKSEKYEDNKRDGWSYHVMQRLLKSKPPQLGGQVGFPLLESMRR